MAPVLDSRGQRQPSVDIDMTRSAPMADTLRIVVGSDCAGIRYKDILADQLRNDDRVSEVIDVGRRHRRRHPLPAHRRGRGPVDPERARRTGRCWCAEPGWASRSARTKSPGIRAVTAHDSFSVERAVLKATTPRCSAWASAWSASRWPSGPRGEWLGLPGSTPVPSSGPEGGGHRRVRADPRGSPSISEETRPRLLADAALRAS